MSEMDEVIGEFLVESYETERVKVLSVWSEFKDDDLWVRPNHDDPRGRSVHEHMVHQCVSEDAWFRNMLGIDVGAPPLPPQETRLEILNLIAGDPNVDVLVVASLLGFVGTSLAARWRSRRVARSTT